MAKPLILASTSVYRKELFSKIGIPFITLKPSFDEDFVKNKLLDEKKSPIEIAEALSLGKSTSCLSQLSSKEQLILSGDQLVHFNGKILGKAGNFNKALEQLQILNGQTHELITAVTLLSTDIKFHLNHITRLKMKKLTTKELENYLKKDTPYDCAGSYKVEKSGLALFEKIDCDDFSAIQGLPLMWITQKLKELKYELFQC